MWSRKLRSGPKNKPTNRQVSSSTTSEFTHNSMTNERLTLVLYVLETLMHVCIGVNDNISMEK
jgi:hypothetical protein